jgi:hypothetical protein
MAVLTTCVLSPPPPHARVHQVVPGTAHEREEEVEGEGGLRSYDFKR